MYQPSYTTCFKLSSHISCLACYQLQSKLASPNKHNIQLSKEKEDPALKLKKKSKRKPSKSHVRRNQNRSQTHHFLQDNPGVVEEFLQACKHQNEQEDGPIPSSSRQVVLVEPTIKGRRVILVDEPEPEPETTPENPEDVQATEATPEEEINLDPGEDLMS